jgi:hypothetical protein
MAHDVFISHASADKAIADAVCASLERHGIRCWIAPRDIRPGADWGEAIVEGIKHARVLVLVFSAGANASTQIPREVERAVSHEIPIVPFRIEDVSPHGSLEYNLATVHWLDAMTPPLEAHITHLAATLRSILSERRLPPPVPLGTEQLPSHVAAASTGNAGRGRSRWLVPAAVGLLALAGLGGYFALGRRGADEIRRGVTPPAPQPSGPRPADPAPAPTSPVTPAAPGPTVTGPTVPDPERESFKRLALDQRQWFVCDTAFCSFTALRTFFAGVKRIQFGEAANQLDRSLDLPPAAATFDQAHMQNLAERYTLQYIPIRPGSSEMHVRLEFYDGTMSDVRPATIQADARPTTGIRLNQAEPTPGRSAPALFVGFTMGADKLQFLPDAPFGTTEVMYAFDEAPFARARSMGGGARSKGFEFEGPPLDAAVRVRFIQPDGTEQGPFRYALQGASSLVLETFKAGLAADLDTAIHCTRIAFALPLAPAGPSPADRQAAMRTANYAQSMLNSSGLAFVTSAPVVACVPARARGRPDLSEWAAVREVRIGTAPGQFDQQLPVAADWRDALARKLPQVQDASRLWHALLPTAVEAVYVQLAFRDGSTSHEVRLTVDEIRLPAR